MHKKNYIVSNKFCTHQNTNNKYSKYIPEKLMQCRRKLLKLESKYVKSLIFEEITSILTNDYQKNIFDEKITMKKKVINKYNRPNMLFSYIFSYNAC